ncbi:hypothetical protein HC229_03155 [Flavobacterium sp. D33]|nr:hypothetical protein [Flavobacterium selenitireducens]
MACSTQQPTTSSPEARTKKEVASSKSDTIRIANDSLEYEILIIDPGFNSWMLTNGRDRGFYSQSYLEGRNIPWVTEWNIRARSPRNFQGDLYTMEIDYRPGINYGYEVNYLLFNYLTYFQLTKDQRLGGPIPRL